MEVVLDAAGMALFEILQPDRMIFLVFGVCIGLMIGILPGMSGIAGMALLLPFTYDMEPITASRFSFGPRLGHDHKRCHDRRLVRSTRTFLCASNRA